MEELDNLKGQPVVLLKEVTGINSSIIELDRHFSEEGKLVCRREWTVKIKTLRSRLECEIGRIQDEERGLENASRQVRVFSSAASFAFGSIVGALMKTKDPLAVGARSCAAALDKTEDFGKVLITVKGNNQSIDISAISISSLMRKTKVTESQVLSDLKRNGYFLITTDRFWNVLDLLEKEIAEGKYRSQKEQNIALLNLCG